MGEEKFGLCCVYIAKGHTKLKIFILFLAKKLSILEILNFTPN